MAYIPLYGKDSYSVSNGRPESQFLRQPHMQYALSYLAQHKDRLGYRVPFQKIDTECHTDHLESTYGISKEQEMLARLLHKKPSVGATTSYDWRIPFEHRPVLPYATQSTSEINPPTMPVHEAYWPNDSAIYYPPNPLNFTQQSGRMLGSFRR
jgi:hypothetical protein